jgi:glycosyltransferase involved in cell wall biosynthesis
MSPKVSVLVPVYNVESYIIRCVDSIFAQTFTDFEVIFVNDASTDNSLALLENRIKTNKPSAINVRVISHSQNTGLALTRLTALNAASGEYISHIDSDDYIDAGFLEMMMQKAIANDADIVVCDIAMEFDGHTQVKTEILPENPSDNFAEMLKNEKLHGHLANKIVRKSLYLHPECTVPWNLSYMEDRYVMTRLFFFANIIVKVDKPLYHYYQNNPNSISRNKSRSHWEDSLLFWKDLGLFLQRHGLSDKMQKQVEFSKVDNKINLLMSSNDYSLWREYNYLFREFELNYMHHFVRGKRIFLWLIHHRMYAFAKLLLWLIKVKQKIKAVDKQLC